MSTRVFALGWIVWAAFGIGWELAAVIQHRGTLSGFFFTLAQRDLVRAFLTAFFAWWVYHWYVEPWMFPRLRGPGPDDIGVSLLAWLLAFFGQREKK